MSKRRPAAASADQPQESGAYAEAENRELETMLLWVWTGMMIIVFAIGIFNAVDAIP